MKLRIFGSLASFALAAVGPAVAADMPVRAPVYKAAPAAVMTAYNWNGCYVGGHAGWDWVDLDSDTFIRSTGAFRQHLPVSWDGFVGGGQLGCNWMPQRNIVLGIEADVSAGNLKTNFDVESPEGIASKELKLKWSATVRGRIGYAFDNWLIYGTGGFALARFSHYNIQITCGPANPTCMGAGLFNPETLYSTLKGWTVGGGFEFGFAPNWTAKLEYLYTDYGTAEQTGVIFNRRYVAHLTTNVVRLGVNYRFGDYGKGPVVAGY